jgi:hypothetical protein
MNVYECIAAVSAELAKTGIAKDRQNEQQRYKFRGIDEVFNALAPLLAKHGLVILPRMLARGVTERTSKSGTAQFFVVVDAEFDFVSAKDQSKHTVRTFGEAQDSADKATNKAMSAAYKYAAFQAFCIPTEGDNDADATTPEPSKAKEPAGYEEWLLTFSASADKGLPALRAAFKDGKATYRDYLTQVDKERYEQIRARAEAKTKQEAAA